MPVITFSLNGGEGDDIQIEYASGGLVLTPSAPLRPGYIFIGWDGMEAGFQYREWSDQDKYITAQWIEEKEEHLVQGDLIIASAHSVIFILPMTYLSIITRLTFRHLSRSILGFNINGINALVKSGDDVHFKHIYAGYISDVLIRPKTTANTKIDFQYTAWETDPSIRMGNVYPLSNIIGNPLGKPLYPSSDMYVALYTASNAESSINKKVVYKNGGVVNIQDPIDPYGDSFFAVDVFYNPLGLRPPIGTLYEGSSKKLLNVNAMYHPVVSAPGANGLADSALYQFIIYENRYAVIGEEIYAIDDINGIETFRLVNSNVGGLKFLGSSTSEAYFYSETLDKIMLFTGSGTITQGETISRFGKVNKAYWSSLRNKIVIDITTQYENKNKLLWRSAEGYEYQLHLTAQDTDLLIIDGDEGLIFQHKKILDLFFFSIQEKPVYQEIIDHRKAAADPDPAVGARARYVGFTQNPLRLKTSFLGQSPTVEMNIDGFVIVFYKTVLFDIANRTLGNIPERSLTVQVQAFTFDQGKYFENPRETVTLPAPSKWNASTFIYRYPLRYNTGVSFSFEIYAEGVVSIIGAAVDVQPDRSPTAETVRNGARSGYLR
jgi:hypothetical protein